MKSHWLNHQHGGSVKLAADWRLDIHIRESAAECEVSSRLDIHIQILIYSEGNNEQLAI